MLILARHMLPEQWEGLLAAVLRRTGQGEGRVGLGPQPNKGGCPHSHFAGHRNPTEEFFGGICPSFPFPLSLPFFFSYLKMPQNSGLPRRRCQHSCKCSCEKIRKRAQALLLHPVHSLFPGQLEVTRQSPNQVPLPAANKPCIINANTWLSVSNGWDVHHTLLRMGRRTRTTVSFSFVLPSMLYRAVAGGQLQNTSA